MKDFNTETRYIISFPDKETAINFGDFILRALCDLRISRDEFDMNIDVLNQIRGIMHND